MRRRLELNLARRPFTNDTLLLAGLGLLAAAGLGLTIWNGARFFATGSQVAELEERRTVLQAQVREAESRERILLRDMDTARSELLASRASFASGIIQARAFSWTRLFNELEQVMPLGVKLVAVRPRLDEGLRIRLDGIARDNESFWELQERLQAWPVFGNVYPDAVQPTTAQRGLAAGEIRVSLELEYFPDAREKLGLPGPGEEPPGDQQQAVAAAPPVPAAAAPEPAPAQEAAAQPASDPQAQPASTTPSPPPPPAPAREKRGKKPPPQPRVGLERKSTLPPGAPGMEVPDLSKFQRPELQGAIELPPLDVIDGQLVDEDGNVVPIDDVINMPGGIRPGPAPDLGGDLPPEEGGDDGGAGPEDGAQPPAGQDATKPGAAGRRERRP